MKIILVEAALFRVHRWTDKEKWRGKANSRFSQFRKTPTIKGEILKN